MMAHIVLLGDSIFDNAAYVIGGPDVVRQLQAVIPAGWRATLRAVDGATTHGVSAQLKRLPPDATHLVLSIGGNDALGHVGMLEDTANSIGVAVNRLADVIDGFERDYHAMLAEILDRKLPTALCTIYEPRFPEPRLQRTAVTALKLFNDTIIREAFGRGLPLLDLRIICDRAEDYANPIEPSVQGGAKIAAAVANLIASHEFAQGRTQVFTR
jgi:hypothetical protein